MANKVFTDESLDTFVEEIKSYSDANLAKAKSYTDTVANNKANSSHTHSISNITNLQSSLDAKVPTSRTVNGKSLTGNITLSASDVGAASSSHNHNDTYYTESEIDSKLSGKANSSHGNHVPTTQTASSKVFLRNDNTWATVTPANIGAAASSHTHTVSNISDLTAIVTELNYVDGVTSNIQTQLDGKSETSHTHKYAGSSSVGGSATSANKLNTNAGSATQPVYFSNGVPVATTYTLGKSVPSNAVFTDTHYSSKNVVGATNATSNTATALTNGNVYINSVENGEVTSSHKISGSGATTVTTDANGNIVISSTDNNTTYSAAGSSLGLVKNGGDVTISNGVITVNDDSHNHTIANIDNLQVALDGKSSTSHTHSYLPLSGGTITGQLDVDKVFRNGNTFYNVLEFANTATVDEIVVKTKIPFISGNSMPLVHLKGYAYGESATIEMTIAFYIYNDKFTNMGVVSSCPWQPNVYLSSYTENNTKYVAISFAGSIYYPRFVVDYTDIWSGSSNRDYSSGWTSSNRASGGTTSVIPTTDKVDVPYKPIANNISGNATTATNVAWSGVTSKPSYYDAKAIKGITRSGTTFTYTCMDGTTGTFTQQDNNTTYSVATTSANGLMSSSDKTKIDSIELATLAEVKTYLGI